MIDGAAVYVKDLEKMQQFYQALGFRLLEAEAGDFAVLGSGDTELSLVQIPAEYAADIVISSPPEAREETPIKLTIRVTDLAGTLLSVAACGGRTAEGGGQWTFRGFDLQDVIDPEGNVLQLKSIVASA